METYEKVMPLLYDKGKLIKQPELIFRTQVDKRRWYYAVSEFGEVKREPSVTTIIDSQMPTSVWLVKWIAELGYNRAMEKRDTASDYGTFFGLCAADYYIQRKFDFDSIKIRLETFRYLRQIDYSTDFWDFRLREDMYALHIFTCDFDVEPVAIELMLFSKLGFAGAIDAVLEMTVGTGQNGKILKTDRKYDKKTGQLIEDNTRRILALVDWKSGRHGFYPQNEAQLHFYKILFEENFPHLPLDALYNWSPKSWASEDSSFYHLKEQSDSKEKGKILNYLENFQIDNQDFNDKQFKRIDGTIELGKNNGNLKVENFEQKVRRVHKISFPMIETSKRELTPEVTSEQKAEKISRSKASAGQNSLKEITETVLAQKGTAKMILQDRPEVENSENITEDIPGIDMKAPEKRNGVSITEVNDTINSIDSIINKKGNLDEY